MDLFYRGQIPQKSEDILNELILQYNNDADNDKKLEAEILLSLLMTDFN